MCTTSSTSPSRRGTRTPRSGQCAGLSEMSIKTGGEVGVRQGKRREELSQTTFAMSIWMSLSAASMRDLTTARSSSELGCCEIFAVSRTKLSLRSLMFSMIMKKIAVRRVVMARRPAAAVLDFKGAKSIANKGVFIVPQVIVSTSNTSSWYVEIISRRSSIGRSRERL